MPANYTVALIEAFLKSKRVGESEEAQMEAKEYRLKTTNKKKQATTSTSHYNFSIYDENGNKIGHCSSVFKHGHMIDPETKQVYFKDDNGIQKWTLANNNPLDQERAKTYVFKTVILDNKFYKTVVGFRGKKTKNKGTLSKTAFDEFSRILHKTISEEFDVGNQMTKKWDHNKLLDALMAYSNVFTSRKGRPTLATQSKVLERHEEMVRMLLNANATTQATLMDHETLLEALHHHAKEQDEKVDDALLRLDELEDAIDDLRGAVGGLDERVDDQQKLLQALSARVGDLEHGRNQSVAATETRTSGTADQPAVVPSDEPTPTTASDTSAAVQLGNFFDRPLDAQECRLHLELLAKTNNDEMVVKYVSVNDFAKLKAGTWLNDAIIDGFCRLLCSRAVECQLKCHFVSSFFFHKLVQKDGAVDIKNVRRTVRNFPFGGLFELNRLFVPINKKGVHWALMAIDFDARTITGYDSLGAPCIQYARKLREFLQQAHESKYGGDTRFPSYELIEARDIPQQMNGYDCGVFVCMYAYFLSLGMDLSFNQAAIDGNIGLFPESFAQHFAGAFARAKIGSAIVKGKVI